MTEQLSLDIAIPNPLRLRADGKCFQPFRADADWGFVVLCWGTHGDPDRCQDPGCPRRL